MDKTFLKKILPYAIIIAVIAIVSSVYMSPQFSGKVVKQHDIMQYIGMSKELSDHYNKTGENAMWTNSMFGGMPGFQIFAKSSSNVLKYIDNAMKLFIKRPAGYMIIYMLGFLILLLALRVDKWTAVVGALAYGLTSYLFIIIGAGHNSKAHAIGYMAPVLAGIILTYRGKYIIGALITAVFLSLQIYTNHLQITYYLLFIIVAIAITEFVYLLKAKQVKQFIKASSILFIASLFAIASNLTLLWTTYSYSKETIRGKSELVSEKGANVTGGLDLEYATSWSYGKMETFTLLVPNFNGGESQGTLSEKSESYRALISNGVAQPQAKQIIKSMPLYWGTQPGVAGPIYVGAIIIFLFVLAMFVVKGKEKYWLLAATVISIVLAWGKNFAPLTELFMHYVPMYNKFRAVSMILVIAELTIPLLAILGLSKIIKREYDNNKIKKQLYYSLGITAGIALFFAFAGNSVFSFSSSNDAMYVQNGWPNWLVDALQADRANMLKTDAWRSAIFIILAGACLYLYITNKNFKKSYIIAALAVLVVIDLWGIDKRYLNKDNFIPERTAKNPFTKTKADETILQDTTLYYRVFNQTVSPFNDASTSYFHKSIGGYHGAKLRRYQDIIERQLSKPNETIYNMLNTRWFIVPSGQEGGGPVAMFNDKAFGNAWFVENAMQVGNANEEMKALDTLNPLVNAVYDKKFESFISKKHFTKDSATTINLVEYAPNKLKYQSKANSEQLAVFSEIYYENGWNAYIDGKLVPHFRVDYILRALIIPQGEHTIDFKFEPKTIYLANTISFIVSLVILLCVVTYIVFRIRKYLTKIKIASSTGKQ